MTFEYILNTLLIVGFSLFPLYILYLIGSYIFAIVWDVVTYIRETPRRKQLKQLDIDYRYVLQDPGKLNGTGTKQY